MINPHPDHQLVNIGNRAKLASDLVRGAYSGKETYLYYNSATHETPTWVEIPRARNIQINDGPGLADVEFHGAKSTSQIPGYSQFNGSMEYVRRTGVDAIYDALKNASENGDIIELVHLNGPITEDGNIGWRAPIIFGEFAETANGGDPVVATIPLAKADAYDDSGNAVEKTPVTSNLGSVTTTVAAVNDAPPVTTEAASAKRSR